MRSVLYIVLVLTVLGIGAAAAQDRAPYFKDHAAYLALGDSVPFGYNLFLTNLADFYLTANKLPLTTPLPDLLLSYSGYPQDVSELLKLDLTNASCPGQTSSSFLSLSRAVPDNGCDQWRINGLPLFVTYTAVETQEEYAISFLAAHRNTRLVTITIGGDDLLLLQDNCATAADPEICVESGLPEVLGTFTENLTEIYTAIRSTGYDGPIIAVNYASPNYNNALVTAALAELNSVMSKVTESFGGKVADAFSAFKLASGAEGLPCEVGLSFFTPPSGPGCDVHPTPLGQLAIGQLVLRVLGEDRFPVGFSQLRDNY